MADENFTVFAQTLFGVTTALNESSMKVDSARHAIRRQILEDILGRLAEVPGAPSPDELEIFGSLGCWALGVSLICEGDTPAVISSIATEVRSLRYAQMIRQHHAQ